MSANTLNNCIPQAFDTYSKLCAPLQTSKLGGRSSHVSVRCRVVGGTGNGVRTNVTAVVWKYIMSDIILTQTVS